MSRISYLDKGLAYGPIVLKRLVEQINPDRYDERRAPDRFSIREVAAHLADFEPVIRARMEVALTYPGSGISLWDEEEHAELNNYSIWDVPTSLETFLSERLKTHALFTSLSEEELNRTVLHPVNGELTIFDLAVFGLGHDAYHLEQVSEYLSA